MRRRKRAALIANWRVISSLKNEQTLKLLTIVPGPHYECVLVVLI